jgi:hypothetical protein
MCIQIEGSSGYETYIQSRVKDAFGFVSLKRSRDQWTRHNMRDHNDDAETKWKKIIKVRAIHYKKKKG